MKLQTTGVRVEKLSWLRDRRQKKKKKTKKWTVVARRPHQTASFSVTKSNSLLFKGNCDASQFVVKFLKAPPTFSHRNSAKFVFQNTGSCHVTCSHCSITCKLDYGSASDCRARKILYSGLQDGNHSFGVCINGSLGPACSSYNWTVVHTNALFVVHIHCPPHSIYNLINTFHKCSKCFCKYSFTEACAPVAEVLDVRLSMIATCLFMVLAKLYQHPSPFWSRTSRNTFTRSPNSTFYVHYGDVFVDLRVHVPEIASTTKVNFFLLLESIMGTADSALDKGLRFLLVAPVTFLYDSQRTAVRLSTTCHMRTREDSIPISINFHEISRSIYSAEIRADDDVFSISVPENVTGDVAGNKNLASNVLRVRHYTIPVISSVISIFVTAVFL
ncbi:hypothetical protein GQ457_17G027130 [Hibiscus cannabinus]